MDSSVTVLYWEKDGYILLPPPLSLSLSFSLCHALLFPLCISCFLLLFESLSLPMTYLSSSKHLKGRFPSNSIHEFGKPLLWLPTYLYTCEKVNNEAYSSFINTYLINIKNGQKERGNWSSKWINKTSIDDTSDDFTFVT